MVFGYINYFKGEKQIMNFEAKTYKRLGAIGGSIIGVLAMIIAVSVGKTIQGALLLILFTCLGIIIGILIEKKMEE